MLVLLAKIMFYWNNKEAGVLLYRSGQRLGKVSLMVQWRRAPAGRRTMKVVSDGVGFSFLFCRQVLIYLQHLGLCFYKKILVSCLLLFCERAERVAGKST